MRVHLDELCAKKGISIYEMSFQFKEVNLATLYNYNRGATFPRKKTIEKLLKYFDCTIDKLIK